MNPEGFGVMVEECLQFIISDVKWGEKRIYTKKQLTGPLVS